ncbi:MAG TPA: hypothetical protein VHV57_10190 [Acidimicrobiales bacterium]|nr:hypothetical protein [Acidimicrobiales bacterium]
MRTLAAVAALCTVLAGSGGAGAATAPGLSRAEHAALAKKGAFGAHPVRLLLLGDSIALTIGFGLSVDSQSSYGVSISNHSTLGCDLDPTVSIITSGQVGPATPGCVLWRALWPFLTAYVHPQVVALGLGRWEISDHFFDGQWVHIGQPVWDAHLTDDLLGAVKIFQTFHAKVILFTMPYIDPSDRQANGQPFPENTDQRVNAYNALVERVAAHDPGEITAVDVNHLLDPKNVYTSRVDGVATRWTDGIHISRAGGVFLRSGILPIVDRLALQVDRSWAKAHKKPS